MPVFSDQFTLTLSLEDAHDKIMTELAPLLGRRKFKLVNQTRESFLFEARLTPRWARVFGGLTFWTLIGLFFFAIKTSETLSLALREFEGRTRVTVSGDTSDYATIRAFAELAA